MEDTLPREEVVVEYEEENKETRTPDISCDRTSAEMNMRCLWVIGLTTGIAVGVGTVIGKALECLWQDCKYFYRRSTGFCRSDYLWGK